MYCKSKQKKLFKYLLPAAATFSLAMAVTSTPVFAESIPTPESEIVVDSVSVETPSVDYSVSSDSALADSLIKAPERLDVTFGVDFESSDFNPKISIKISLISDDTNELYQAILTFDNNYTQVLSIPATTYSILDVMFSTEDSDVSFDEYLVEYKSKYFNNECVFFDEDNTTMFVTVSHNNDYLDYLYSVAIDEEEEVSIEEEDDALVDIEDAFTDNTKNDDSTTDIEDVFLEDTKEDENLSEEAMMEMDTGTHTQNKKGAALTLGIFSVLIGGAAYWVHRMRKRHES